MVVRPYLGLIVFWVFSCASNGRERTQILWEGDRPTGLLIPYSGDYGDFGDFTEVSISLRNSHSGPKIIGSSSSLDGMIHFSPLIDLTYRQTYFIFKLDKIIDSVYVPVPPGISPPELKAIYPSADTLPQNLLKMYFVFTKPMAEGAWHAIDLITVTQQGDTLLPFLDLQPELWNEDRTRLTLWLDPGRIKSGLIPNLELGLPLNPGSHLITVSDEWADEYGLTLSHTFSKTIYIIKKDSQKPDPKNWQIIRPAENTVEPLEVIFDEPLDYVLASEGIIIYGEAGKVIAGSFYISEGEKSGVFLPEGKWQDQIYRIRLDAIIEDCCGNNLNRLFEEPVNNQKEEVIPFQYIEFHPVAGKTTAI